MDMMIETSRDGSVATLQLNRPEKHNALGIPDLEDFEKALEKLEADQEIRVLILTGAGNKTFCAGVSLGDLGAGWTENPLDRLCNRLEGFRTPVICALNGSVFGGAVDIALACDFRIGVEGMWLLVPAAKLGVHFELSGLRRFVSRLGVQNAKRLLIGVEEFSGEALYGIGFLDQIVAPSALTQTAQERAESISTLAPLAVEGMKSALNAIAQDQVDESAIKAQIARCWGSQDLAEGLAAHAQKRLPQFRGA